MDITQIYMASPDWLKLVLILTPWLTVYGVARLWRDGQMQAPRPQNMPAGTVAAWPATAPRLLHELPRTSLQQIDVRESEGQPKFLAEHPDEERARDA